MEIANTEHVAAIVEEALNEAVGKSSKKWALIVLALVVGAMVALLISRRTRSLEPAAQADTETT